VGGDGEVEASVGEDNKAGEGVSDIVALFVIYTSFVFYRVLIVTGLRII
jgi:hypothetical protein